MTTKVNGNRKLPPYDELYALLYTKGMSYKDVAAQYGVHFSAVSSTLRRDRTRLGLPWPIQTASERSKRISRQLDDILVDAMIIRELLRDAYEEAQATFLPDQVLVSARSVTDQDHKDRLRYHLSGCFLNEKMGVETMVPVDRSVAEARHYKACGTCCHLSVAEWVKTLDVNISAAHMYRLVSHADDPNVRRIRKATAARLLRAIGEEPHEVLTSWKSKKLAFAPKNRNDGQRAA